MLLWKDDRRVAACRFGIAGDFLPASGLSPADKESWSSQPNRISLLFEDLEFSIANLECPVGVDGIPPHVKAFLGDTFAAHAEALAYLIPLKTAVVGIANNHLYDYGRAGAMRTLEHVQSRFACCGFGRSLQELPSVTIRDVCEGVQVGIWAAARSLPDCATRGSVGIEPAVPDRGAQALAYMAGRKVQCRVAFLHAGVEGTNYPDSEDAEFIGEIADMGFDVVAACHSHRISGYKTVRRKDNGLAHCFYGLGSLSSGVLYSPLEHEGMIGAISLDASGAICEVEARPIFLDERGWAAIPSPEEEATILDRIEAISAAIRDGSYRQRFYQDLSSDMLGTQWRDIRVAFQRAGLRGILKKVARMRPAHVRRLYYKGLASIGLD